MSSHRAKIAAIAALLGALVVSCAETERHRVLTWFFDGVPEPGAVPVQGYAVDSGPLLDIPDEGADTAPRRRVVLTAHLPYKQNRCGSCHNPQDGQLFRSSQEGLCLTCHTEITEPPTYLHGPVAVNACDFCHHHHFSEHPGLLLDEATALCLRCHQQADLTTGPHHADAAESCIECHDAHGGSDRSFLRSD